MPEHDHDPNPQQSREEPPRQIADELELEHKELVLALQRELRLIV